MSLETIDKRKVAATHFYIDASLKPALVATKSKESIFLHGGPMRGRGRIGILPRGYVEQPALPVRNVKDKKGFGLGGPILMFVDSGYFELT